MQKPTSSEPSATTDGYAIRFFHNTTTADGDVLAIKDIRLSFVPFPGLKLDSLDGAGEDWFIDSVTWNFDESRFDVDLASSSYLNQSRESCRNEYIDHGWQILQ